jgi:hypothetical protein
MPGDFSPTPQRIPNHLDLSLLAIDRMSFNYTDPRLMDLCSITLIHRFTSPEWFKTLRRHVSIMEDEESNFV